MARVSHILSLFALCIVTAACGQPPLPTAQPSMETPTGPSATPTTSAPETPTPQAEHPTATSEAEPTSPTSVPSTEEPTASATTPSATELSEDVAVLINGQTVTRETYLRQVTQARSYFLQQPGLDATSEAGKQALARLDIQVLEWLIDQVLIEQAAISQGISISEQEIEEALQAIRGDDADRFDSWLAANALTMEELREQLRYDLLTAAMRDRITSQLPREVEQINVRHILTSEESAAQRAVQALRAGGNFIALARQVSEDATTRSSGGELGFIPRGVMPPTFDEVAFAMQSGEISDIVRSEFGFHVIQVVEIDPARRVPDELWPVVQERAFAAWLDEQRAQSEIHIAQWVTQGQEG